MVWIGALLHYKNRLHNNNNPDDYGIHRDSECVQNIGSMVSTRLFIHWHLSSRMQVTKAGRALCWPNLFQHRVSPFRLSDSTTPGHRKIMAIFLVDPTIDPVVSATDIPLQQAEWGLEAFEQAHQDPQSRLSQLPRELFDLIVHHFPKTLTTLEETEAARLELMEERTASVIDHTETAYGVTFNMCEH